jgi:hypothetical protein
MPRPIVLLLVALAFPLLLPSPASAVKRSVVKSLKSEYGGRFYQLRLDLRGTDFFAAFNVVDHQGVHYRGREQPVLFYQLETVYLDQISNEGERQVRLTIYRNRDQAYQIRGSVPGAPLPVGPSSESTLGAFARDLSTNVMLEVAAGRDDPGLQSRQMTELMGKLFYIKEAPTYDEKEAFILAHPDLPVTRLAAITGLGEDLVQGVLKRREADRK